MSNNYWLEHWEQGITKFHRDSVNPLLEKYWPELNLATNTTVLVPLCGKSLDMLWLAAQSHNVIGIELSPIACENFFTENKLGYKKEIKNKFTCYFNENIKLYCGDFFDLTTEIIPEILAVYDRAALIALPNDLRKQYAEHLIKLISPNGQILLLTHSSPGIIQGPPYSVSPQEIENLFSARFDIKELMQSTDRQIPVHLEKKGYKEIHDFVYLLK
ncbi:MAG TPA: thiopurine S-methyltransferase [Gammaproteobacteria bacterium]|nr:thiopurine S-methyltransferase [Gammaproteobacteria bacterium]